uniref:Uncharacterized protein n=1 Tax=Aegilops tauschii subsp. strangulata TaxID=200361 RepID=A0A453K5R0_AEGTS
PTPDPDPLHPRPPFHLLSSPNPLAVGPAEEQRRGHGDEQETRRVRCPRRRARLLARPARSRGPSPPSASPKPVPHSSLLIRAGLLRLRREGRGALRAQRGGLRRGRRRRKGARPRAPQGWPAPHQGPPPLLSLSRSDPLSFLRQLVAATWIPKSYQFGPLELILNKNGSNRMQF